MTTTPRPGLNAALAVVTEPCACTGQCGKPHTVGTKRTPGPCGHLPTFHHRHVAAPADPSEPPTIGAALLPYCGDCYTAAVRRGTAARTAERERHAAEQWPQGGLF